MPNQLARGGIPRRFPAPACAAAQNIVEGLYTAGYW